MRSAAVRILARNLGVRRPKVLMASIPLATLALYQNFGIKKAGLKADDSSNAGYYELEIEGDLSDGQMKEVQVGPKKEDFVLISKVNGKYYCTEGKCSHFGFNLSKGVLLGDKVICPLHNASFSVVDGTHEGGPVLNGLQQFEITELGNGKLKVKVPISAFAIKGQVLTMAKKGNDSRKFLIIGGGPAGVSAAETLRQAGFEGEITVLSSENHLSYDRTMLTKAPGDPSEKFGLRSKDFFTSHDIDFETGVKIETLDASNKVATASNGKTYQFDKVLVATGAKPIMIPVPGINGKNVFALRTKEDVKGISEVLAEKSKQNPNLKIGVIGGSFIGMEMSATLKKAHKDADLNVYLLESAPFENIFGKDVGEFFKTFHESNGVKISPSTGVIGIEDSGSKKKVILSSGNEEEFDLVILGTGVKPSTPNLKGISTNTDGSILTDAFFKSSNDFVYAAGDVATFPYVYTGQNARIEHYNVAFQQGSTAALNMLGKHAPYTAVPFFWTRMFDVSFHYVGHPGKYDSSFVQGDFKEGECVVWYFKNHKVMGAFTKGSWNGANLIAEGLRLGVLPSQSDIESGAAKMDDIRKKVMENASSCGCSKGKHLKCH